MRRGIIAASAAAAWTPAEIAGILDYGVFDDLTRLKQNSDGTGTVSSTGDPVGFWRGQLDVLTFIQPTTANKPVYRTDGVEMYSSPSSQKMYAARTTPWNAAFSMGMRQVATVGNKGSFMSTAFNTTFSDRFFALWDMSDPNKSVIVRGTKTTLETNSGILDMSIALAYSGSSSAFGYRTNGTKVAATVGASTGASDEYIHIGAASGIVESKIKGWIIVNAQMSDADVALWQGYVGALP